MRIGINALSAENRSGTGRYTTQLLLALARVDKANTYVVCTHAASPLRSRLAPYPNFDVQATVSGGTLRRYLFERNGLPRWIAEQNLDLFHGPAFIVPEGCPVPSVVTIHDLIFHLFPKTTPLTRRGHYRKEIPRSIREASLILADSQSTARDLQEHFGVDPALIRAVHLGVEPRFFEDPGERKLREVHARYALPERFLLTIGTLEPRKNLPRLLEAYAQLLQTFPKTPCLVAAGRTGWGTRGLQGLIRAFRLAGRVHLPGFVAEDDLPALYRLADLFVSVSLYEGFGLPVLEAMACGTPVVAAGNSAIPEVVRSAGFSLSGVVAPGNSSFPEVVGDTALLTNAEDPNRIAQTLREALTNPDAARLRAEQAQRRAQTFTWEETAEKTRAAYEDVGRMKDEG